MRSALLRKIRIVVSLAVLLAASLVFIDIRHLLPENWISSILFLQFVPSTVKIIGTGTLAAGAVIILVLTVLTGRTYCSFLCPLGIFQDILNRIGGLFRKRFRRFRFLKPLSVLRYTILAVTLIFTLTWGITLVNILDPYSIFGRIMTYFTKPVIMLSNNLLASIFGKFDIYTFVNAPLNGFAFSAYLLPVLFLILVGVLSVTGGRLYCNAVCPVGTFLGLLSKISVLRIKFDSEKCTKCGRCSMACKSSCIDFLNKQVDTSRCVDCFNCLKSCPEKAMVYGPVSLKSFSPGKTETADSEKRKNLLTFLLLLLGTGSVVRAQNKTAPIPKKLSKVKEKKNSHVSPPGSVSISNFVSKCTACSLCISACPNNVLVPSVREFGLSSVMQPHLDFHKGFCAYECVRCLEICPTGALMPLALEAKKLTQIGKAVFIKDNCIVNTEKTACGACAEACPTKAVHMIPFVDRLVIPETTDDICIGCGHCENACPTTPYKAIFVDGNPIHKAAKKPVNIQTDLKKPEEFPF
jgi:ferredoxin-type protein NapF